MRSAHDLACVLSRLRADLLGLLARVLAHALGLGVNARDRREGVVARRLGLRACGAQDLLGLRLGRADAVLARAVALGDALASTCLGLLAQAGRRLLGGRDDRCHPRGDLIGLFALHGPMLDLAQAYWAWQKTWDICPCRQGLKRS